MKRTILAEARWEEKYHHWKINASVEGRRRSFYSSDPSRHGKKEAEAKAQAWADLRSGSDMPFQRAVENWLDFKEAHVSVSTFKVSPVLSASIFCALISRPVAFLDSRLSIGKASLMLPALTALVITPFGSCVGLF